MSDSGIRYHPSIHRKRVTTKVATRVATTLETILATVILSTNMLACGDMPATVTVASLQSEQDADQESWGVALSISDEGIPRVHMTAGHMLKYERPDSTYLLLQSIETDSNRVRVDIFDAEGDSSAVLFADRIYYFEQEDRFVARGDVVVTSVEHRRIESEHLVWTEDDHRIRTPGFATIISESQTISGYNLVSNEDLSEATLARVTGTFNLDKS